MLVAENISGTKIRKNEKMVALNLHFVMPSVKIFPCIFMQEKLIQMNYLTKCEKSIIIIIFLIFVVENLK